MITTDETDPAGTIDRHFGLGLFGGIAVVLSILAVTLLVVACGVAPAETATDLASLEPAAPMTATPTPEPTSEPLPTGRSVLSAAEGTPHVLWFWGAN